MSFAKLERLLKRNVSRLDQEAEKNQRCMEQLIKTLDQQLACPCSLLWKEIKTAVRKNSDSVTLAMVQLDQNLDYNQLASISEDQRKQLTGQLDKRYKIPQCDFTAKEYFEIKIRQDLIVVDW